MAMHPWWQWLPHVAVVLVPTMLAFLLRNAGRTERESGRQVLRYGWVPRLIGLGGLGFMVLATASVLWLRRSDVPWGGFVLLFAMSLYLIVETFGVRVVYDGTGIYCQSPWRADRSIPWEEVEALDYSRRMKAVLVRTRAAGTVWLFVYISGWKAFVAEAQSRGIPFRRA